MVRFVTGICLFGKNGAVGNFGDGVRRSIVSTMLRMDSPIESISIDDNLSVYEVDTACRLSSVIGSMAEVLPRSASVYVHIPMPEYVLFMMGHLTHLADGRVMKEWLEAVERRGMMVQGLFEQLLASEVPQARVHLGSPLDELVMPALRKAIESGAVLSPGELVKVILSSKSRLAEIMAAWLAICNGCEISYYDLARFGYVSGVVMNVGERGLTVEVENPAEERIFQVAARVMKSAWRQGTMTPTGNLMAIYPYEQTVAPFEQNLDSRLGVPRLRAFEMIEDVMRQYGSAHA